MPPLSQGSQLQITVASPGNQTRDLQVKEKTVKDNLNETAYKNILDNYVLLGLGWRRRRYKYESQISTYLEHIVYITKRHF